MSTKSIDESLFGLIRRQLLSLFFLNPEKSFYLLELINILRTGRGGVQREVANLVESGIITREKSGMKVFFSLSEDCAIKDEMQILLCKFIDYEDILSSAVKDYGTSIRTAVMLPEGGVEDALPFDLLVSLDGDIEAFQMEIKRIELLTGTKILLLVLNPDKFKEYIASSSFKKLISDGKWKLLAGRADDLMPVELETESGISEPDLFSGKGFTW